jgi:hypothetical protein
MSARRNLVWILAVAVVLVAARQAVRWMRHVDSGPAADADWIWAQQRGEPGTPMVFFAIKDFDLAFEPRQAELRVLADEEYQLAINDRGVCAGRYQLGAPLDAYPVGLSLHRGTNRLAVELRSARGAGGMLLRLEIAGSNGERAAVVSDGSWRIVRRFDEALFAHGDPAAAEAPVVWGQPAGRWGAPGAAPALTLRRLRGGLRGVDPAERLRRLGGHWEPAPPHGGDPLGRWVTFDFGHEGAGFLNLLFADTAGGRAFVFYGVRQPKDGLEDYDEVVLRAPGRDHWTTSAPARFRYVTVVAEPAVSGAELVPVDPRLAAPLFERAPEPDLFGIERRRELVTPVEDEVRRKLEGVPGLAGRKEG